MQALGMNRNLTIPITPSRAVMRPLRLSLRELGALSVEPVPHASILARLSPHGSESMEVKAVSAIADVARLAGVSKATASRALSGHGYVSEETRDRVEAAAAEIGYVVSSNAASLVTGRTRNVGVVIPFINRWFFAEVLEGIESLAHRRGLRPDPVPAQRGRDRSGGASSTTSSCASAWTPSSPSASSSARTRWQLLRTLGKPIVGHRRRRSTASPP